jgi:predicted kinase
VLAPTHRLRYSPGSLVVVVGASATQPAAFAERVVEERGAAISLAHVKKLLVGRVDASEIDSRAQELLDAAVMKRLQKSETVLIPIEGFDRAERERYTRMAHSLRRPRHLILLDAGREDVPDDERAELDQLRRAVDAGEVGAEGFQTAMRLGGNARSELKRIIFRPPPSDD